MCVSPLELFARKWESSPPIQRVPRNLVDDAGALPPLCQGSQPIVHDTIVFRTEAVQASVCTSSIGIQVGPEVNAIVRESTNDVLPFEHLILREAEQRAFLLQMGRAQRWRITEPHQEKVCQYLDAKRVQWVERCNKAEAANREIGSNCKKSLDWLSKHAVRSADGRPLART